MEEYQNEDKQYSGHLGNKRSGSVFDSSSLAEMKSKGDISDLNFEASQIDFLEWNNEREIDIDAPDHDINLA